MQVLSSAMLLVLFASTFISAQSSNRIAAAGGDIVITPIIHSSVQVEYAGMVIHVDPWSVGCLLYTSPSPRDLSTSRMPSSA